MRVEIFQLLGLVVRLSIYSAICVQEGSATLADKLGSGSRTGPPQCPVPLDVCSSAIGGGGGSEDEERSCLQGEVPAQELAHIWCRLPTSGKKVASTL